jgi:Cysteine rich repeat
MNNYLRASLAAATLTLALATGAVAQGAGQGPVGQNCTEDIAKFCAGKEHGGGEVRACLEANKDKVSDACKTALDTTGPGRGRQQ